MIGIRKYLISRIKVVSNFGYKRPVCNLLYLCTCLHGLIIYSERATWRPKLCWIFLLIFGIIMAITSALHQYHQFEETSPELLQFRLNSISLTIFMVLTSIKMITFKKRIQHLLDHIDNCDHGSYLDVKMFLKPAAAMTVNAILIGLFIISKPTFVIYDRSLMNDPYMYPYPPFNLNTSALCLYLLNDIAQIVAVLPIILISVVNPLFVLATANEFFKEYRQLQLRMREMRRKYNTNVITEEEYELLSIDHIQHYQRIIKGRNGFASIVQDIFNASLCLLLPNIWKICIIILMPFGPIGQRIDAMFYIVPHLNHFVICNMDIAFQIMNEMISRELFSTPWFTIQRRFRSTMHIFFMQALHSKTIPRNLVPVNIVSYVKMLAVYYVLFVYLIKYKIK